MWISRKKYNEMKQCIIDLNANLDSYHYSLNSRTKQVSDYILKVSEIEQELEKYKQKYADEVQKRLDLINHIDNNKIDKAIEEIEIAFYKMK